MSGPGVPGSQPRPEANHATPKPMASRAATFAAELGRPFVRLDEHLLHQILRFARVVEVPASELVNPGAVAVVERTEGVHVASTQPLYRLGVGHPFDPVLNP